MSTVIEEIILTRPKIGDGSDNAPFGPDMEGIICRAWVVIEERETEYDVKVYGYYIEPSES